MKMVQWALAALLGGVSVSALSQEISRPWEEYDKLVKTSETVGALGPTLFGDSVNFANGALSFSATDLSIPGNNGLPVAFTRSYAANNRKGRISDGPLADWDLDLPSLSGTFAPNWRDARCAVTTIGLARPPTVSNGGSFFYAEDYWQGNQANIPGGGEMLLVSPGVTAPTTGGPYYWMTSGFTYFSCLATIKNGTGEGFLAITPDGTRYWFDWMAQFTESSLKGAAETAGQINRRKNVLYATRVEDRFGNWVTYSYSNASNTPGRLIGVSASDGRQITVGYNPEGHVSTVSDGGRTWTYQYSYPTATTGTLTAVIQPDNSRWTINFAALSTAKIRYDQGQPGADDPVRSCASPGDIITPGASGTITHPSGAIGEFTVDPWRHGRSNVPMVCANYSMPFNDNNDDYSYYPLVYDALSLTKKRVTGPGLTPTEWNYGYGATVSFAAGTGPVCTSSDCGAVRCTSDSCAGIAVAEVTGPGGEWMRYTFGNSYRYNEGKLLKVERGTGPTAISKTDTSGYLLATSGQAFPTPVGTSPQPRGDGFTSEYLRPQVSAVVSQDGATFSSQVAMCGSIHCFDQLGRSTRVVKGSSLGYSKTDAIEYYDDASKWVMGQTKRAINADNGEVISQTDYDPATALPIRNYAFGLLKQTLSYHADGTVATVTDGNNHSTQLSNWKRGVPQNIQHHDNTSESAVVHNAGWVESATDENGFTTNYGYDVMGRLASIVYPTGDSPAWNNTTFTFAPSPTSTYGLPAGHWRQTVMTGNARTNTFFDALWRPIVKETYDAADVNGTLGQTITRYDIRGRATFVSFPQRNLNPAVYGSWADPAQAPNVLGIRTSYDALDRVTRVEQDSELGTLSTTTEYLSGFQRRITNPRGFSTTQRFQAYDQPTYDAPIGVDAPQGVSTVIVRDRYLKPLEVTRSGPDG